MQVTVVVAARAPAEAVVGHDDGDVAHDGQDYFHGFYVGIHIIVLAVHFVVAVPVPGDCCEC